MTIEYLRAHNNTLYSFLKITTKCREVFSHTLWLCVFELIMSRLKPLQAYSQYQVGSIGYPAATDALLEEQGTEGVQ